MVAEHPPINAVGALVYRVTAQGQVEILLIKKRKGVWTLPKGRVKRDESALRAIQREVAEETGISGIVQDEIAQLSYVITKHGEQRQKIVTYYLMQFARGKPCPDKHEQIKHACWVPLYPAMERVGHMKVRAIVERGALCIHAHVGPIYRLARRADDFGEAAA